MLLPTWLVILGAVLIIGLTVWSFLLASGRNPLPFPDPGSRIFTAASPEAKEAVVELLARHGLRERFQANSSGILRSILWDGTIINHDRSRSQGVRVAPCEQRRRALRRVATAHGHSRSAKE